MSNFQSSGASRALVLKNSSNNVTQTYVFAAFAAVACYNAIELAVLCFITFKRYHGCYFWALLISSAAIIPHCLGYVFFIFPLGISAYISVTMILITWCIIITGQSLVLWSRLHLVLQNTKLLRAILWMIIVDAIIFHIPIIVLLYGAVSPHPDLFAAGYNIMERIQLVGFCLQELIISGIYVWETTKLLRLRTEGHHKSILLQLLVINIVILILDVAIVGIEYAGYYSVQVMFKPVAYSIKLKLEYAILGKLVEIAKGACSEQDPSSSGAGFTSLGSGLQAHSSPECMSDFRELQTPSTLAHSEPRHHDYFS